MRLCRVCKKIGHLQACGRCRIVLYCGTECQMCDWPYHKAHCIAPLRQEIQLPQDAVVSKEDLEHWLASQSLPADRCEQMLLLGSGDAPTPTPFWSQYLRLRPSKRHGRGIFATVDIPPFALLTFYPAHLVWCGDRWLTTSPPCNDLDAVIRDYGYSYHDGAKIVGLPHCDHDSRFLGHLINEASDANPFLGQSVEALVADGAALLKRVVVEYSRRATGAANCALMPNRTKTLCTVVSCRPIRRGEELGNLYGIHHWLAHTYSDEEYVVIRDALTLLEKDDAHFFFYCL